MQRMMQRMIKTDRKHMVKMLFFGKSILQYFLGKLLAINSTKLCAKYLNIIYDNYNYTILSTYLELSVFVDLKSGIQISR